MSGKTLAPIDCNSEEEACDLETSMFQIRDLSIFTDGCTVTIADQKSGEPPKQEISIKKKTFDEFIVWYQTKQAGS